MTDYHVEFVASAAREFHGLPADVKRRVAATVEALRQAPRPSGARKLHGSQQLYRIRIGQYRVVYEIDDPARLIRVMRVRHRREAYR